MRTLREKAETDATRFQRNSRAIETVCLMKMGHSSKAQAGRRFDICLPGKRVRRRFLERRVVFSPSKTGPGQKGETGRVGFWLRVLVFLVFFLSGFQSKAQLAERAIAPTPRAPIGQEGKILLDGYRILSMDWETKWRFWGYVPKDFAQRPESLEFAAVYWLPEVMTPAHTQYSEDIFGIRWYPIDFAQGGSGLGILNFELSILAAKWSTGLFSIPAGKPEMTAISLSDIFVSEEQDRLTLIYSGALRIVPTAWSHPGPELVTFGQSHFTMRVHINGIERGIGYHEGNGAPLPNIFLPRRSAAEVTYSVRIGTGSIPRPPLDKWEVDSGAEVPLVPSSIREFEEAFREGGNLQDNSVALGVSFPDFAGHVDDYAPYTFIGNWGASGGGGEAELREKIILQTQFLSNSWDQILDFHFWAFISEDGAVGGNLNPLPVAEYDIIDDPCGSVSLDARGSTDPDGEIISYTWTWSGGSASGVNPTVTLPRGGTVVTLTVADEDGGWAQTDLLVNLSSTVELNPRERFAREMTILGLSGDDAFAEAEPFRDGVSNLLKYAFNMNLASPDRHRMSPGGVSGLPSGSFVEIDGRSFWRVQFVRRKDSGLLYEPLKSADMHLPRSVSRFTSSPHVEQIECRWERVTYDEPVDLKVTQRLFSVVRVSFP